MQGKRKIMKVGNSKQKEQRSQGILALQPKICYMDLVESTMHISMEREFQTIR
jgi:hypothetical protein